MGLVKLSRCVRHDEEFHEHCVSCLREDIKELQQEIAVTKRWLIGEEQVRAKHREKK